MLQLSSPEESIPHSADILNTHTHTHTHKCEKQNCFVVLGVIELCHQTKTKTQHPTCCKIKFQCNYCNHVAASVCARACKCSRFKILFVYLYALQGHDVHVHSNSMTCRMTCHMCLTQVAKATVSNASRRLKTNISREPKRILAFDDQHISRNQPLNDQHESQPSPRGVVCGHRCM
jgi:hypothetical protein